MIKFANIEVTTHCNMSCNTCNRTEVIQKPKHLKLLNLGFICNELQKEDVKEIKVHGLGELSLAPSELVWNIRKAFPRRVNLVGITNGQWGITERIRTNMAMMNHLYFSVDGYNRETYRMNKPTGNFDLIGKNIVELRHPNVSINCVITNDSYFIMPDMVKYAESLGVKKLRFNLFQNWGDADKYGKYEIVEHEELIKVASRMKDWAYGAGVDADIIGNPDFKKQECKWLKEMVYITVDGDIVPCCMRRDKLGNIFHSSLKEVLSGSLVKKFIEERGDVNSKQCSNCPYVANAPLLKKLGNTKNDHSLHR